MGTKANPGDYDCDAAAADHEPRFTLLGRDVFSFFLIRAWAWMRDGQFHRAIEELEELRDLLNEHPEWCPEDSPEKVEEAKICAREMWAFFQGVRSQHVTEPPAPAVSKPAATPLELVQWYDAGADSECYRLYTVTSPPGVPRTYEYHEIGYSGQQFVGVPQVHLDPR